MINLDSFTFDLTTFSLDKIPNYLHWLGCVLIQKATNVVEKHEQNIFFFSNSQRIFDSLLANGDNAPDSHSIS